MEKEKNIIIKVNQNLKENIKMEKEMEKEKNIILMKKNKKFWTLCKIIKILYIC